MSRLKNNHIVTLIQTIGKPDFIEPLFERDDNVIALVYTTYQGVKPANRAYVRYKKRKNSRCRKCNRLVTPHKSYCFRHYRHWKEKGVPNG